MNSAKMSQSPESHNLQWMHVSLKMKTDAVHLRAISVKIIGEKRILTLCIDILPWQQYTAFDIWHALEWQIWIAVDHCYCELVTVLYRWHCQLHAGRTAHPDVTPTNKMQCLLSFLFKIILCYIFDILNFYKKERKKKSNVIFDLLCSFVIGISSPPVLIGEVSVLPAVSPCHVASAPPVHKSHQTRSTEPGPPPSSSERLTGRRTSFPSPVSGLGVPGGWLPVRQSLCSDTVSRQPPRLSSAFRIRCPSQQPVPKSKRK